MSLTKKILLGIGAAVVAFLIYVALQPAAFTIERTMFMIAPQNEVFNQVNDFRRWQAWSPWAELDPEAKATFEGPAFGPGAVFKWAGNDEVGEGQMSLLRNKPHESITIKTEFMKPYAATNDVEFTFATFGNGTNVTWKMTGSNDYFTRIFCTLFNMKAALERDFDNGLTKMKSIVETKKTL